MYDSDCDESKDDATIDDLITRGGSHVIHHHQESHLSTIIEANSPYGTEYGGSRKSIQYPPTAASIFSQLQQKTDVDANNTTSVTSGYSNLPSSPTMSNSAFIPTSESESPYYPLGSEASNRPTTPRFTVEEVSSANYEPILINRSQGNIQCKSNVFILQFSNKCVSIFLDNCSSFFSNSSCKKQALPLFLPCLRNHQ